MNKVYHWENYTTDELRSRLRKLERLLIRPNDEPEPDPEEINSIQLEIADREDKKEA